ncbi:matrixin family metalloprotease [Clostridium intestinale]|uniref:Matrixin family metalloprotease n=1 Tax=Clostridium intestinale TaxID=36845 RepID=A0A7D6ZSF2_9CLOT|nr:matrixin family metalloprotease [Clostridium intestinale]QLY81423.1 matrixin family metalloprotease [Clostridium intestinale]
MKLKKLKKRFLVLSVSFVMLFTIFGTTSAHAEVYGGKWKSNIYIYCPPTPASEHINSAIAAWNRTLIYSQSNIRLYSAASSSSANVIIDYRDYYGAATAETFLYPSSGSPQFTSGTIIINNNKYNYLSYAKKNVVAIHELGHILGLAHHFGSQQSIMIPNIGDVNNILLPTSYDQSQIDLLY